MSLAGNGLASLRRVRVGSMNGPKIAAVRAAFAPYAAELQVEGADVESGVSDQPVGYEEIARGAHNRARAALARGGCDLAVGYEDGLVVFDAAAALGAEKEQLLNVGCAVVTDGERDGFGLSSGFPYPPECAAQAVRERAPIGDLFDDLWRSHAAEGPESAPPSAKLEGNVGKLSLGALTRAQYAQHAVYGALLRFLHPGLYAPKENR